MVIGEAEVVDALIASSSRPVAATTVMTGVVRALNAVGARRIGVAAPYHDEVNTVVQRFLIGHGFEIADYRGMNLTRNSDIDRVSPASIADFARAADDEDTDAVFICCGALRALDIVGDLENELGKPVIVSNQAMMWDCLRLAGVNDATPGYGRLFELDAAAHAAAASKPLLRRH
jgi:maleate isomerase